MFQSTVNLTQCSMWTSCQRQNSLWRVSESRHHGGDLFGPGVVVGDGNTGPYSEGIAPTTLDGPLYTIHKCIMVRNFADKTEFFSIKQEEDYLLATISCFHCQIW